MTKSTIDKWLTRGVAILVIAGMLIALVLYVTSADAKAAGRADAAMHRADLAHSKIDSLREDIRDIKRSLEKVNDKLDRLLIKKGK